MGPQHPFKKYGQSGQEICEIFPQIGTIADDICIIRSVKTEAINHDPAHTFMNTGSTDLGPSLDGLLAAVRAGSRERRICPGFVVMTSTGKFGQSQPIASRQWHNGFLPSRFQGVEFRSTGDPVMYVSTPAGVSRRAAERRGRRPSTRSTSNLHDAVDDPEIATRIAQYEMAFRMQTSVPELMDVSDEPQSVFDLYGTRGGDGSFAANCLLARRLAERGVRFIQLYHRDWDHHGGIKHHIAGTAGEVDRGTAALIQDLKQRGMLATR